MARIEHIEFECDICRKTAPARVVDTGSGEQATTPVGWLALEARVAKRDEDKTPRLKAEVCSVACGTKQLEEWAA